MSAPIKKGQSGNGEQIILFLFRPDVGRENLPHLTCDTSESEVLLLVESALALLALEFSTDELPLMLWSDVS